MATASTIKVSSELLEQLQQSALLKGTSVEDELREFLTIRSEKKNAALSRIRARHGTLPQLTAEEVTVWIEAGRRHRIP